MSALPAELLLVWRPLLDRCDQLFFELRSEYECKRSSELKFTAALVEALVDSLQVQVQALDPHQHTTNAAAKTTTPTTHPDHQVQRKPPSSQSYAFTLALWASALTERILRRQDDLDDQAKDHEDNQHNPQRRKRKLSGWTAIDRELLQRPHRPASSAGYRSYVEQQLEDEQLEDEQLEQEDSYDADDDNDAEQASVESGSSAGDDGQDDHDDKDVVHEVHGNDNHNDNDNDENHGDNDAKQLPTTTTTVLLLDLLEMFLRRPNRFTPVALTHLMQRLQEYERELEQGDTSTTTRTPTPTVVARVERVLAMIQGAGGGCTGTSKDTANTTDANTMDTLEQRHAEWRRMCSVDDHHRSSVSPNAPPTAVSLTEMSPPPPSSSRWKRSAAPYWQQGCAVGTLPRAYCTEHGVHTTTTTTTTGNPWDGVFPLGLLALAVVDEE